MRNERGAIIIHVALLLVALLLFAGFIVDHGELLVARSQAQAAADAGALAGAESLLVDAGNLPLAVQSAQQFATTNAVWGQNTAVANVYVPPLPFTCPNDGTASCIRVDVLRGLPDSAGTPHTNTLPTFLMGLVGINDQGTRATATAQVAAGNAVRCIKPWVVADKWTDNSGTGSNTSGWDQNDLFEPGTDTYTPPAFQATGPNNDYGLQLVLHNGQQNVWSSGWTSEIDLGGTGGTSDYVSEITGCPAWVPVVGLYDPSTACASRADTNPEKGCINVKPGMSATPTANAVQQLIDLDPTATWDQGTNQVSGGCMAAGTCQQVDQSYSAISARIVPIAIFDLPTYIASGCSGNNCVAHVVNLLGFFLEGMCDDVYPNPATRPTYCGTNAEAKKALLGRLMRYPGQFESTSGPAGPATFLRFTRLVR